MPGKQKRKGSLEKKFTLQDAKSVSTDDLRKQLKHLNLKATGKRNELLKRLEQAEQSKMSVAADVRRRNSPDKMKEKESKQNGNCHTANIPSDLKLKERQERENIVLWKKPLVTIYYFIMEIFAIFHDYGAKLVRHKLAVISTLTVFMCSLYLYNTHGSQYEFVRYAEKKIVWCIYWVGLGILSSVGLGTGLHTFLLYLGPHIASVTLAAYECESLNFPEPPYPDEIICPDDSQSSVVVTMWKIMRKVQLEAFMWGAGTALGELPPYFMAKAARISGKESDDEELQEFEELLQHEKDANQSFVDRTKLAVEKLVERVGFFGILACASIPNPLFDLAGITCGHFLVPFWTFFGATLIGKAIIKMHIQKLFVIIAFNEHHVEQVVDILRYIPYIGVQLQAPFKELLAKQKASLHRKAGTSPPQAGSWLSWIFEKFVILMICYFVLSIINSMAQSYHKRCCKERSARKPGKVH